MVGCEMVDVDDRMYLRIDRELQLVGKGSDLAGNFVGTLALGCGFALCRSRGLVLLAECEPHLVADLEVVSLAMFPIVDALRFSAAAMSIANWASCRSASRMYRISATSLGGIVNVEFVGRSRGSPILNPNRYLYSDRLRDRL